MDRYGKGALSDWLTGLYRSFALAEKDARLAAEVLVETNLIGVDTHGFARVPTYLGMFERGELDPKGTPALTGSGLPMTMDGALALGQIAGPMAVDVAMAAAQQNGASILTMNRSGHLGALGVLLRPVAEAGLIGVMMQSGPPAMGMPGARTAVIGNNPLAFVAPVEGGSPIIVDIALSTVAMGKLIEAARLGQPIPPGWGIDSEGNDTTDAAKALRGMLLPMSGHKGLGLALMVEVLAGALTGMRPQFTPTPEGPRMPAAFGCFLMVIDPAAAIGLDRFRSHVSEALALFRDAEGRLRYPGTGAVATRAERERSGIPLPAPLVATLSDIGMKKGLAFPKPLSGSGL
ncbi:MAG: Ldh family oxidoreductase [Hyphomicrobiales bacterium]|nr:Ldh family oxidoreductase [Hyphomicrobiales bacterium]